MKRILCLSFISLFLSQCNTAGTKDGSAGSANAPDDHTISRQQFEQAGMALGTIEEGTVNQTVFASGMIDVPPDKRAVVSAYHAGYIKSAPFLVGESVAAGQVVATLENPEFLKIQQAYLEVAGQMEYLEAEYQRQEELMEEQISSRKKYLQAESAYKSALASYQGLRKQLELLRMDPHAAEAGKLTSVVPVTAPISGTISRVAISKGMYVSQADPILEIINNEHIHLELAIFEKDLLRIQTGQTINFRIPDASADEYTAKVYLVGNALRPDTRTITVHGHLEGKVPEHLAIGMFVEASIVTHREKMQVLPETAMVSEAGLQYAAMLVSQGQEDMVFRKVELKTGNTSGGFTAILNGKDFPPDAQFLVRGAYGLLGTE